MMSPSAVVICLPLSRLSAKPSASVNTRSISEVSRSSIETTSNFLSRDIRLLAAHLTRAGASLFIPDYDRVGSVDFSQPYVHPLPIRCLDIFANVVGANWKLALAAIDKHRQLHRLRPAEIRDRIE